MNAKIAICQETAALCRKAGFYDAAKRQVIWAMIWRARRDGTSRDGLFAELERIGG